MKTNYRRESRGSQDRSKPFLLLVHGFGASVNHWRRNIEALASEGYTVFAIDLLGFGASDKVPNVGYSLDLWKDQILDFIEEMSDHPEREWVLVGNSIGSLVCLMVASRCSELNHMRRAVRGLVLVNCSGGLLPFRYSELPLPLAVLLFFIRKVFFNKVIGQAVFERFRSRENIMTVLQEVYVDKTAVCDELVEMMHAPSCDPGAKDVFLEIFNADCGPTPESLMPKLSDTPMLVLWGEKDPWTPFDRGLHPGNKFPALHDLLELVVLEETGHCPHDERPDIVNAKVLDWLGRLRSVSYSP